jgi:hypothetical protein
LFGTEISAEEIENMAVRVLTTGSLDELPNPTFPARNHYLRRREVVLNTGAGLIAGLLPMLPATAASQTITREQLAYIYLQQLRLIERLVRVGAPTNFIITIVNNTRRLLTEALILSVIRSSENNIAEDEQPHRIEQSLAPRVFATLSIDDGASPSKPGAKLYQVLSSENIATVPVTAVE